MRVLLMHPNYHSGGAEIAGNWPPAWVAYLTGYLKAGGYTDVIFVDAMTNHLSDDQVRQRIADLQPDVIGCTAITPAIYKAERLLQIAKEVKPDVVTVLGGIHGTFMYPQVLKEAPWIDAVVRGEGEQVFLNLVTAVDKGDWARDRNCVRGIAYLDRSTEAGKVVATPAEPTIQDLDRIAPDWGILDWGQYIYIPMGRRVAIPNFARGCPFTCTFCSQWKFWRDYRVRDPIKVVDEIETLVRDHDVGFFILADEEPTIHRKKFIAFCEELIKRKLPVLWGINTRVTDILRDEKLLPMFRKAGLIHVSPGHRGGGAAEARPLQQGNHGRAEQEGHPAAARGRHRDRGAVHRRPGERDRARRWKRPTRWRATGTPTWPTGRCTRRGRSRTCSRSSATRSRCSTSRSTTS